MCGIFGGININVPEDYTIPTLVHRGPDGFGLWKHHEKQLVFGHRRLSILDLSENGKQPMHGWNCTITLNGEIYNFLELRKELKSKGYNFKSETDTEVVLAAYKEWGEACVHRFNGMWAFAIWDEQTNRLFFSKDRFGKKPLFYYRKGDKFVFASEMKALFPFMERVKPSSDFKYFVNNQFNYESTDKCVIEGIKRFPAGSNGVYDFKTNDITLSKYWNTKETLVEVSSKYDDQVEQFRELFLDACKMRMRSDVPIGTALSGGLDSSAVICSIAHIAKSQNERTSKNWQNAIVGCFPGAFNDERVHAEKVTNYLNIPATFVNIDPVKAIDTFYKDIYLFEDLYITSPFPMMQTYGGVKEKNIGVTLDGHGADELLAGYGRDSFLAFLDAGANIKQIKNIIAAFNGQNPNQKTGPHRNIDLKDYYALMVSNFFGRKNLLKFYLKSIKNKEQPHLGNFGKFNSLLFEQFNTSILPTLLRNYDRYSMARSVEIRMPFMDHRLVSFCFSLPWTSKIRNGYSKAIVRDALAPYMPKEIVWRKEKIGFNTPIVDWMKNEWKEFFLDTVNSAEFNSCTLIDAKRFKNKTEELILKPKTTYIEGQDLWKELYPFFWEKSVIKSNYWR